jgi:hypothetical protein
MPETSEDELHIDQLLQALASTRNDPPWVETMALPDVIGELLRWLDDDGQWNRGGASAWKTLISDVRSSVAAYPAAVVEHAGDRDELLQDLREYTAVCGNESVRTEGALRRGLYLLAGQLEKGLRTPAALRDAWDDLRHRSGSPEQAERAARRLLALARWYGHDEPGVRDRLVHELRGDRPLPQAPIRHRLRRAEAFLASSPPRATVVVYLRLLFASIPGEPKIGLGTAVTLYRGTWLRKVLAGGHDSDAPPEVGLDNHGYLRSFCRRRVEGESESETNEAHNEIVDSFARVELHDVLLAEAIPHARRTVATLSALGALYGAAPSLWQLDTSYVTFRDGGYGGMSFAAPPAESPTITERVGMGQDPTAEVLRANREKLAIHLPVDDGPIAAAAELLGWLREARSAATASSACPL